MPTGSPPCAFLKKRPRSRAGLPVRSRKTPFSAFWGGRGYLGGLGSPMEVRPLLDALRAAPGHQFWPDDVSLSDRRLFPALPASRHLTDLYLLGLAVKHGGRFATFDQNIDASLIPGGRAALFIIEG